MEGEAAEPRLVMHRLTILFGRANQIYHTEGLMSLVRQGFAFLMNHIFEYRTYYLKAYRFENVKHMNENAFIPKTDNVTIEIVASNEEADELEAEGLEFRSHITNARERLDSGAIAFCIFIGQELANIGWVAMTQQAKDSLNGPPLKVDFSNNEGYLGGTWTNPKYRRLGLHTYVIFKRLEFMLDKGLLTSRSAIAKTNTASLTRIRRLGVWPYGEGRYLRLLWWKSWKEKPVSPQGSALKRETQ